MADKPVIGDPDAVLQTGRAGHEIGRPMRSSPAVAVLAVEQPCRVPDQWQARRPRQWATLAGLKSNTRPDRGLAVPVDGHDLVLDRLRIAKVPGLDRVRLQAAEQFPNAGAGDLGGGFGELWL
jgi:hypothetical protein